MNPIVGFIIPSKDWKKLSGYILASSFEMPETGHEKIVHETGARPLATEYECVDIGTVMGVGPIATVRHRMDFNGKCRQFQVIRDRTL
jgi:predicted RNA-binding Zn-ribbon protein involved in translation (DUF1610 family)